MEDFRNFQIDNWWIIFIPVVLAIVIAILVFCVDKAREPPLDILMLLVFVLSVSYVMSFLSSILTNFDNGPGVPLAMGATVGITSVLTVYACLCKGDFLIPVGIVLMMIPVVVFVCLMIWVFPIKVIIIVFAAIIVIVLGVYLVVITSMIIGHEYAEFPMDSPILASLYLYIITMRMFLYLIMILGGGGGKRR